MNSPRGGFDLSAELRALRPKPKPEFGARLDARAAASFPRSSRSNRLSFAALAARLRRDFSRRRLAFATCGAALAAIAIATALIAGDHSTRRPMALDSLSPHRPHHGQYYSGVGKAAGRPAATSAASAEDGSAEIQLFAAPNTPARTATAGALGRASHREIERSAEIGLLADPSDVDEDSAKVFGAVHDADGIVLRSTTTTGRHGGAHFELLIPSAKLGDALAAFSAIDEVRSRHEATADITVPTVAAGERLRDSQAKIDSLLSRLAAAETESEAAAIEVELQAERRQEAVLHSHLAQLQRRADYTRVDLRIETGASSPGGSWSIGDAFHDSGHILGIAAGVILIGFAVLSPLALLCLLAWLSFLAWRRSQRKRALRAA